MALGDCAVVPNAKDGKPSPTLAQFALRQARQLAANLKRELAGQPTRPFSFRMLGSFAAIGHHNAVGDVLGVRVSGIVAWFMWRAIYLGKMPTLARKVQIAFDWAWELVFARDIVELSALRDWPRAAGALRTRRLRLPKWRLCRQVLRDREGHGCRLPPGPARAGPHSAPATTLARGRCWAAPPGTTRCAP